MKKINLVIIAAIVSIVFLILVFLLGMKYGTQQMQGQLAVISGQQQLCSQDRSAQNEPVNNSMVRLSVVGVSNGYIEADVIVNKNPDPSKAVKLRMKNSENDSVEKVFLAEENTPGNEEQGVINTTMRKVSFGDIVAGDLIYIPRVEYKVGVSELMVSNIIIDNIFK
ncbi:MAG: hypothetical protein HGA36_00660 [Candidatus Moranbacteria bacterium]|nr:hypothetical protein [Candidatus Moranbacteria bacterium]